MPLTQQKHYTVGYHDTELHCHEICEYAENAYEARLEAIEDVPYIHAHPNCINYILAAE